MPGAVGFGERKNQLGRYEGRGAKRIGRQFTLWSSFEPFGVPCPGAKARHPSLATLAPAVLVGCYGSITNRLSPVTCLLKLVPRAFALTPSLVPGGACPPGSWIWQLTSYSP